jgi:lipopolysaccharide export system permease protein
MLAQVTPFSCLLSTLYAFGKLNHENEIIAMRSSGLSILQMTKTVIIFGFLVSLIIFWLGDRINPRFLARAMKLRLQIEQGTKKDKKQEIIENLTMYGLKNRLFFINKFYVATNTMERIIVLEHDEHQNITKKIVANKGVFRDGVWRFYQSITYNFDQSGQIREEPQYLDEEIMVIPEGPQDFINQRQHPEYMGIAEMDEYIWKLSRSGATSMIRGLKVDYYQRFTAPFGCLIIILLGIPFSLIMRRRATGLSSIGIAILVAFLYFIVNAVSIALGKGGVLFPVLAASLSHIIAAASSLYFIYKLP